MEKSEIKIPKKIESDRLIIRPYSLNDAGEYYEASKRNREHLAEFESGNVINEIEKPEDSTKLIGELNEEWDKKNHFFMGIFSKESGKFVGQIYIGIVKEYRFPVS